MVKHIKIYNFNIGYALHKIYQYSFKENLQLTFLNIIKSLYQHAQKIVILIQDHVLLNGMSIIYWMWFRKYV
jgi:hypothetical protein